MSAAASASTRARDGSPLLGYATGRSPDVACAERPPGSQRENKHSRQRQPVVGSGRGAASKTEAVAKGGPLRSRWRRLTPVCR
jgi:hypothetical protein